MSDAYDQGPQPGATSTRPPASPGGSGGAPAGLKRTLKAFDLVMLGIGAIVGAGIFSLTGQAACDYAGPGIIYSFLLAGVACALAGLCYAELSAMFPEPGSAYAYIRSTLGRGVGWMAGWTLVLEFTGPVIVVSVAWSAYLLSLLRTTLGVHMGEGMLRFWKGPFETLSAPGGGVVQGAWNLPATLIVIFITWLLSRGIQGSARVNNAIVVTKVAIVLLFVALGLGLATKANLLANPGAWGPASLVPAREAVAEGGRVAARYGWGAGGVLSGAAAAFFAYLGFDSVCTLAGECRNPTRDLSIGILGSLGMCAILYVLVALTLTGVVPYRELGVADPIAVGVDRIVQLRAWSPAMRVVVGSFVKLGALAGLTTVILVQLLGQSRIFYAMSRDGLLPWFHKLEARRSSPNVAIVSVGGFSAVVAGFLPLGVGGEIVVIGTLLVFVVVCACLPLLRRSMPLRNRPFRAPFPRLVGLAGSLICLYVMSGIPRTAWIFLVVWLLIGAAIWFLYGKRRVPMG